MTTPASAEMPLRDLRRYRPPRYEPDDFDHFWDTTLTEARALGAPVTVTPAPSPLVAVHSFDVTYSGWGGQPVRAWLHLPAHCQELPPIVVEFSGYGQGRGLVHERVLYALAGYAHLIVDARGQSGGPRRCDTPDISPYPVDTDSVITRGIRNPTTSYLTRLIIDSARALDSVDDLPGIDPSRVIAAGISQGGGLALIAAGLTGRARTVLADVPFLGGWWRGVLLAETGPYTEVRRYLAQHRDADHDVWHTLRYMDATNFAARATVPALFSIGLQDTVCPPSAIYATYNHYTGPKQIDTWAHNGHEGGEGDQDLRRLAFLAAALEADRAAPSTDATESTAATRAASLPRPTEGALV